MATIAFPYLLLVFTILSLLSSSSANGIGFSADLIHMDSPLSPFYNPSLTSYEHLANTLRRSHKRANYFASMFKNGNESSFSSAIIPDVGGFLMKMALGTPPFTIYANVDTGSHVTWTQCMPCFNCFKQQDPLFNPEKSSTYKLIPCKSDSCLKVEAHNCTFNDTCQYSVYYSDNSYSKGLIASETLTLGSENSQVSLPGITFGCGFENGGNFFGNGSGIVGLGGRPSSLISQLESSIHGKFSYCLAPEFAKIKTHSQINFGTNALVSGDGVLTTPMDIKSGFYYLTLEALSIGNDRVNLTDSSSPSNLTRGNIVIDSGTTLTYLPPDTYKTFESLIMKYMGNDTIPDPMEILSVCYRVSDKLSYPTIQAHFTGASIELKPINTFITTKDFATCLAFYEGDVSIYGNVAQTNFLVGYDTIQRSVSFKPFNCGYESQ